MKTILITKIKYSFVLFFTVLTLSACGSGGSGGGGGNSSIDSGGDPPTNGTNNWDSMQWDSGLWQ